MMMCFPSIKLTWPEKIQSVWEHITEGPPVFLLENSNLILTQEISNSLHHEEENVCCHRVSESKTQFIHMRYINILQYVMIQICILKVKARVYYVQFSSLCRSTPRFTFTDAFLQSDVQFSKLLQEENNLVAFALRHVNCHLYKILKYFQYIA